MKDLLSQALRTVASGLDDLNEGDQFGIAVLIVILTMVVTAVIIFKPLLGFGIIGCVSAVAFIYLIVFPWIKSFR